MEQWVGGGHTIRIRGHRLTCHRAADIPQPRRTEPMQNEIARQIHEATGSVPQEHAWRANRFGHKIK
eukprot:1703490-Prorocentrum_lima.AAC.1